MSNNITDTVQIFLLQENKDFQISIFLQALPYLEKYQEKNGEVTFYDVFEAIEILSPDMLPDDRKVYAYLIYETALLAKMIGERPGLKLNRKFIRSPKAYINFLEEVLKEHAEFGGIEKIEKLIGIAALLFPSEPSEKPVNNPPRPQVQAQAQPPAQALPAPQPPQYPSQPLPVPETAFRPQSTLPPVYETNDEYGRYEENSFPESNPTNEHVVRFLAHIRKSYMDMIFPQALYDQLLLVIYVAVKCGAPLAHRELMDMVLSVKEKRVLPGVESISKTKVRGVFSLLKNAQALETSDGVGEGVRLFMGRGIACFLDFREKHDAFLQKCIIQQHFFIPINSRRELMWPTEKEELAQKLVELAKVEKMLDDYFMNGGANAFSNSPQHPPQQQQIQQQQHQQPRPTYYQQAAPVQQAPRPQKMLQRGNFPNMNNNQGRYGQQQHQQQQQYHRQQNPNQNRSYYPVDQNAGYDWDNQSSASGYQYSRANNSNNQNYYQKNDAQFSTYSQGLANTYGGGGGGGAGNEFTDFENSSYSGSSLYSAPSSFRHSNPSSSSAMALPSTNVLDDHDANQHLYSSWNVDLPSQTNHLSEQQNTMSNNYSNSFGLDFNSLGGSQGINNDEQNLPDISSAVVNSPDFPNFTPRESSLSSLNALDYPSSVDGFSFNQIQ